MSGIGFKRKDGVLGLYLSLRYLVFDGKGLRFRGELELEIYF